MSERDDDLDPDLAALYAAERAAPLPEGAAARVLAGALPRIAAVAGFSKAAVIAIAAASAIGGGAATLGYTKWIAPAPVRAPAPAPAPAPTPSPPASAVPPAVVAPPAAASVTPAPDAAPPADAPRTPRAPRTGPAPAPQPAPDAATPTPPPSADDDNREPLLIDRARSALRRGLVDEALATLMRHERVHPRGTLAEERDVLVIEAYLAQGARELARRRIERYHRDHPDGFLKARVQALQAPRGAD